MKKQFLHEDHNRQEKAKKAEYTDRFLDEGDGYDRGGKSRPKLVSISRSTFQISLSPILAAHKESLLKTLLHQTKFEFRNEIGTIPRLLKNSQITEAVRERSEMTRLSVCRSAWEGETVPHPKANHSVRLVRFKCFLTPALPFQNPIFEEYFAFLALFPTPLSSEK